MIGKLRLTDKREALPVALAAVFNSGRVLLIRRKRPPFSGLWGMLGGKVRYGEDLDEAVVREVREESGVRARFESLCGVVTESLFSGRSLKMNYLLMVCRLQAITSRIRGSGEGEVRWFGIGELARMRQELIPSDWLMLERLVLQRPERFYYRCVVRKNNTGRYRIERFR
ncbi:MAG: NUDIX domain-containing protein [candidate division WOR-3 bacterium]